MAQKYRQFEHKKTGDIIRYDKGNPIKKGHGGKDHYHWKHKDLARHQCYDADGNIVVKGSLKSHLYPPDDMKWDF